MDRLELVETVREKAGVGYSDAKEALDASNDDLLDALVWLEQQGRSQTRSAYATTGAPGATGVSPEMQVAQSAYARASEAAPRAVAGWFSRVRAAVGRFLRRGVGTKVVSRGEGEPLVVLPLLPTAVGMALWLALTLQAMQGGYYHYVFGGYMFLLSLAAPLVCFFYLIFGCRIQRPAAPADSADANASAEEPSHD